MNILETIERMRQLVDENDMPSLILKQRTAELMGDESEALVISSAIITYEREHSERIH